MKMKASVSRCKMKRPDNRQAERNTMNNTNKQDISFRRRQDYHIDNMTIDGKVYTVVSAFPSNENTIRETAEDKLKYLIKGT